MTSKSLPGAGPVLSEIVDRARALKAAGEQPVAVFDLDHTLFDNGPRTWRILSELAAQTGRTDFYKRLQRVTRVGVPYLLNDIMALAEERDPAFLQEAPAFWGKRFFTDAYQAFDEPLPGAVDYCRALYAVGTTVVYLSGRDAPQMLTGCADSLRRHGFPVGVPHTLIVLKPTFEMKDHDFKFEAVTFIRGLGHVVGAFDNEPIMCNLFVAAFPEAFSVLLKTTHAPNPPALHERVVSIPDFVR